MLSLQVNHPLWEQCEKYFHEFKCERKGETSNGQASHLILCLNQKIADGLSHNFYSLLIYFAAK